MEKKREQERGPRSPKPKVDPGKQGRGIERDREPGIDGEEPMRRDRGGTGDTGDIERDGTSRPGQEGRDRDMTERRPHRDEP